MADSKVIVRANGPYRIEGDDIRVCDEAGNVYGLAGRTVVSLCRCGQSQNKPFCDGSHAKVGFVSESKARDLPPPAPKPPQP
jgi:CDGSH-type Zn-finger protein